VHKWKIAHACRDLPLDDQVSGPSTFQIALRRLISHSSTDTLYNRLMRLIPGKRRDIEINQAKIDDLLKPKIDARLKSIDSNEAQKTVIDLALKEFKSESQDKPQTQPSKFFIDTLLSHIKIFLFAGHDTTAITLSWAYRYVNISLGTSTSPISHYTKSC
jgi:cytochrome P450